MKWAENTRKASTGRGTWHAAEGNARRAKGCFSNEANFRKEEME